MPLEQSHEPDRRGRLMAVRRGEVPLAEVLEELGAAVAELERLSEMADVPAEADLARSTRSS
jgi:hypothetical protein